jgi:DNA-binding CsgD family transcriptional regulator
MVSRFVVTIRNVLQADVFPRVVYNAGQRGFRFIRKEQTVDSLDIPWLKINELVLMSGDIRDPRELCVDVVRRLPALIPYDQARVYFVNDNGRVYDEELFGADKSWSRAYIDYFSHIRDGLYSCPVTPESRFLYPNFLGNYHDWQCAEPDEFVTEYIRPQGLRFSLGFGFQDAGNMIKCVCTLDRTSFKGFSNREINTLGIVQAHMGNLHKNLFVLNLSDSNYQSHILADASLTEREAEIACLLCDGITPKAISKKLIISLATVNKHISNIYSKLHIGSRQQLFLKLLGSEMRFSRADS